MSLRAFQRPLAVAKGRVLVRVIGALDHVPAAGHVELAIGRAVYLVGKVAAVVLFVALERPVHALSIGTVKRACRPIRQNR